MGAERGGLQWRFRSASWSQRWPGSEAPGHEVGNAEALGRRAFGSSRTPILCYHSISHDGGHRFADFGVAPAAFARQMRLLRRLGYRSLTLHELMGAFETGERIGKAVVLTFDDGYLDTFTTAAPILAPLGFRATVFVVTDLVGQTARWAAPPGDRTRLATWEQVRALRDAGWEVGLHAATHRDLTTLSDDALSHEIGDALGHLKGQVGSTVSTVAYPYGKHSPAVIERVMAAGVRAAVTVSACSMATRRSPRYALPRCSMRRKDSLLDVLSIVLVGYRPRSFLGVRRPWR